MVDPLEHDLQRLDGYRNYLHLLVRLQLGRRWQTFIDPSDIVQEALLKAISKRDQCKGTNGEDVAAWLRSILANQVVDEVRKRQQQKRDVRLEVSLEADLDASSTRLESWLTDDGTSPSQRAVRHEELLQLANALIELPEDQRRAVELHHLHGLPVQEVADELGRSRSSVAGLLRRALKRLQGQLRSIDSPCPPPPMS